MWTGVKVKGSAWGILGVYSSVGQMAKQQVSTDVPTREALIAKAHFGIEFSHKIYPFSVQPPSPNLCRAWEMRHSAGLILQVLGGYV